jgi:hypothetical protein
MAAEGRPVHPDTGPVDRMDPDHRAGWDSPF